MKIALLSLLPALFLASCAMDVSSHSLTEGKAVPAGSTVHLTRPCELSPIDNIAEGLSVSAKYYLHAQSRVSDKEVSLPMGQEVKIVKYRKFLINEGGVDTGAIGVVKGGPQDGARFAYVLSSYDPTPWR